MRLINADEIKKREHDVILANGAKHRCFDTTRLYEIPTVDAVPVIRCKDCKYYQRKSLTDDEWKWCMQWHNYTDENVYCSLAERKEE